MNQFKLRLVAVLATILVFPAARQAHSQAIPIPPPVLAACAAAAVPCVIGSTVTIVLVGGVYWWAVNRRPVVRYGMMTDPEKEESWTQEVKADDQAQALRRCQALARQFRQSGAIISSVSVRPKSKSRTNIIWICTFTGER